MVKARRRRGPSDPQAILARRAAQRGQERARERIAARDPAQWGVNAEILSLAANDEVTVRRDPVRTARVLHARRSDAFSALHAAGGLSDGQHQAAQRYFRDWLIRAGVKTDEERLLEMIDGAAGDAEGVSHRSIMAGCRIVEIHRDIGRAAAALLEGLVEPLVMRGEIRVWRVVVAQLTGETERHAQGAVVRQACEAARLGYEAIDRRPPPAGYGGAAREMTLNMTDPRDPRRRDG